MGSKPLGFDQIGYFFYSLFGGVRLHDNDHSSILLFRLAHVSAGPLFYYIPVYRLNVKMSTLYYFKVRRFYVRK